MAGDVKRRMTARGGAMWTLATMFLVVACAEQRAGRTTEELQQSAERDARGEAETGLCERYASASQTIVQGWYPTPFQCIAYDGIPSSVAWSLAAASAALEDSTSPCTVPERSVKWTCAARELTLELELPTKDGHVATASAALGDLLAAFPWKGLDPERDGIIVRVRLVGARDTAIYEPG